MIKLVIALLAGLATLGIVAHITGYTPVGLVAAGMVMVVALVKK